MKWNVRNGSEADVQISSKNNLALAFEGAGRSSEAIEAWKRVLAWSVEHGDDKHRERATRHLGQLGVEPAKPETPE